MEASVFVMKCTTNKKLAGVRVQKTEGGDWIRTWAFPLSEKAASYEGYEQTKIRGSLRVTNDFPGCPHCGSMGLFICRKCKKLSCWNEKDSKITCPWCGKKSTLQVVESLDVKTNAF